MACGSDADGNTDEITNPGSEGDDDDDVVDGDDDGDEPEAPGDDDVDPPTGGDDDDDDGDKPTGMVDGGVKPPSRDRDGGGTTQPKPDASKDGDDKDSGGEESPDDAGEEQPNEPGDKSPTAGCQDGITDYKAKGKFTYKAETSGAVKMWVPAVPEGCKVPVVHLSNGTGANCGNYRPILEHLASHGFFATCYESANTGQGTQCMMALETAMMKHPEISDKKIGSTGHSQGGGAAFVCLARAEEKWGDEYIYAGHSMEPASGFGDSPRDWSMYYKKIKSPMFMFNGSADVLVSSGWVGQAFNAMGDTEKYWYEATGAAHIPVPTKWTQESAVVFFRWKLLGDKAACEYFKKMPDGPDWAPKMTKNAKDC